MAENAVAVKKRKPVPKGKKRRPPLKKQLLSLERKKSLYGYLFVSPLIIGFAFIYIPVLVQSMMYAFSANAGQPGRALEFVGWQNFYNALFVETGFLQTVFSSTVALLPEIFIIIFFAFFMANVLNQNFKGRTVARVIFFIPVVLSTGIITYFDNLTSLTDVYESGSKLDVGVDTMMFDFTQLEQLMLSTLGSTQLASVISTAINSLYSVITSAGVQMLVFLSGLQSISSNMYEAAKVEGATGWEVFWKISFPMISPLILVNLLYTVIDLFTRIDNQAVNFINEYFTNVATYSLASAFSWIYTLVVIVFVAVIWLLVKKLIVYQD